LAEPVRVTSGEHDGFTRLVFDYGRPVDWQVGRSADGYELRLTERPPPYDLTNVFAFITRLRLAALWATPESGQVQIGLACACHAIPFEFRPGIIVIDLKDGPPPKGSSFEVMLDGTSATPIEPPQTPRPRPRPDSQDSMAPTPAEDVAVYDWTQAAHSSLRSRTADQPAASPSVQAQSLLPADPGLQPLRKEILQQIARGASQGVVDMALPKPPDQPQTTKTPKDGHPAAQIRIGEAQTSVLQTDDAALGNLGAKGNRCIAADQLAVTDWGDEKGSFVDQMANLRQGLSLTGPTAHRLPAPLSFSCFLALGPKRVSSSWPLQKKTIQMPKSGGRSRIFWMARTTPNVCLKIKRPVLVLPHFGLSWAILLWLLGIRLTAALSGWRFLPYRLTCVV
jgi:hypothetical protein